MPTGLFLTLAIAMGILRYKFVRAQHRYLSVDDSIPV